MSTEETYIEYPCSFPIKAMGLAQHDIETIVRDIIQPHFPELEQEHIQTRGSSGGKYISVTVTITATSRAQLDAIYAELSACEQIVMAL